MALSAGVRIGSYEIVWIRALRRRRQHGSTGHGERALGLLVVGQSIDRVHIESSDPSTVYSGGAPRIVARFSGQFISVIDAEFGPDTLVTFLDPTMPGARWTLTTRDYVREVSMSRIYSGVHYRFSNEAGEEMGWRVARMAVEKHMRPLR